LDVEIRLSEASEAILGAWFDVAAFDVAAFDVAAFDVAALAGRGGHGDRRLSHEASRPIPGTLSL